VNAERVSEGGYLMRLTRRDNHVGGVGPAGSTRSGRRHGLIAILIAVVLGAVGDGKRMTKAEAARDEELREAQERAFDAKLAQRRQLLGDEEESEREESLDARASEEDHR
jgi:hypothetical protein